MIHGLPVEGGSNGYAVWYVVEEGCGYSGLGTCGGDTQYATDTCYFHNVVMPVACLGAVQWL